MFLTICIPTYNRGKIIKRTLESLICQTDKDFETLVIDDGSADNTYECIKSYIDSCNLRYYWKENGGKHTALNMAIKQAKGKYIMILDSDDSLVPDCVETIKSITESNEFRKSKKYIGVIGKSLELKSKSVIGDKFDKKEISYIGLHFNNKKKSYGDCCECILTSVLKQYLWPEPEGTKFVPESYVFDKIGLKYELLTSNKVFKYVEYLEDGITKNAAIFKQNNFIGFMIYYVSTIENIFPNIKIPLKKQITIWWQYWNMVLLDKNNKGPRVKKITIVGYITKFLLPIFNSLKK